MRKNGFFLGLTLVALLSGCSRVTPESDGVLTQVNGQLVVVRDEQKQKEICKTQFCEPNYTLYANFGRGRVKDILRPIFQPRPVPSPVSTPTPTPSPSSSPATDSSPSSGDSSSGDQIDYAKTIMNTSEAWATTEGSSSVIVADIDSGINLSHPDLKDNLWTNPKEKESEPGVDHDGNGYANDVHGFDFYANKGSPEDQNGHGTHTAGTIAASKNGTGVIGVAPKIKLMPLRFLGPQGQGSTDASIKAIQYAVKMGAKVISASWGGSGYSSYLAQAIADAQKAGVVFVAAAGNDGADLSYQPTYPASLPGVIAVGASDQNDKLTYFSNYSANTVLVAAPGNEIYSTYLNHGDETLSGTSMATPQVSGAIALALSVNPRMSVDQIRTTLCNTADTIRSFGVKCGRINVGRFVNSAK